MPENLYIGVRVPLHYLAKGIYSISVLSFQSVTRCLLKRGCPLLRGSVMHYGRLDCNE